MTSMLVAAWIVVAVTTIQVQKTHLVVDNSGLSEDDATHLVCHMNPAPVDGFYNVEESSSNIMVCVNGVTSTAYRVVFLKRVREVSITRHVVEEAVTNQWGDGDTLQGVETHEGAAQPTTNIFYYNTWRSGSIWHHCTDRKFASPPEEFR